MDVLRENDIRIPEDISFIGYDDSLLAEISEVKLTSVIHPKSQLGLDAAKAMIKMIDKKGTYIDNKELSMLYEPHIKERQSTITLKKNSNVS